MGVIYQLTAFSKSEGKKFPGLQGKPDKFLSEF
jgi:hypothetical protein